MPLSTRDEGDGPPEDPLPEQSMLTLEDYLAMQRTIGEENRFRILRFLKHNGDHSPKELREALGIESSLHHHLNKLVDVGLVEKRASKEADRDGLYTYYRATGLGKTLLDHGVEELLRLENEYVEMYDSDS